MPVFFLWQFVEKKSTVLYEKHPEFLQLQPIDTYKIQINQVRYLNLIDII